MSASNDTQVHICLLGRFEVRCGEQLLREDGWSRRKAEALLQRVAVEKRLLRDEALAFLWPDLNPKAAANNLYRTLYSLRQTLDKALGEGTAQAVLRYDEGVLRLGDDVQVDAHIFEALCRGADVSVAQLQEAVALYHGPLLPDSIYDEWTAVPRRSLQRLYRSACLRLARLAQEPQAIDRAITRLRPLLQDDTADEEVHRELMHLLALLGRRHEALRQYQACMKGLDEQLGVPPTAETRALHESILRGEDDLQFRQIASQGATLPVPVGPEVEMETPLAGRQAELEQLRALLDTVAGGQGVTLLIEGVTGVGKTRLANELLRMAAEMGMSVFSGAAYEFEGHLAYQPLAEAIDRYLADGAAPSQTNPLTHFTPSGAGDPQQEKWALFSNTGAFFANLAMQAPVVLFVDDLHAADEATLQLFHYLARHSRSRPFLLAATYRSDIVLDPASALGALLNALYRERLRQKMSLESLSEEAIARVVRHIHDAHVDSRLLRAIMDVTEGNPFFVEEICRALLRSDRVVKEEDTWRLTAGSQLHVPSDLRQLLRQRVAQSGGAVASVLEVAAVVGRAFDLPILHQVSILSQNDLADALDTAIHAGFIEAVEGGYRFRHGLTRRALYEGQKRPRRQRLHALVADAIEATHAAPGSIDAHVEALAYHYERSDRPQMAISYLIEAGKRAAEAYAFEGAIEYYQHALALMDEHGAGSKQQRWELLESLGWWEKMLANTPRAVAYFEDALALASGDGWQPDSKARARAHVGAAITLLTAGDTATAEPHLAAAQAQIDPETNASEYADILYNVAQLHWHRNEYHEAFEAAQRSLQIAEQLDDSNAVARAFEMLALACHSLGEWQLGLDFEEKRSAIAGPQLDVTDAFDVHL